MEPLTLMVGLGALAGGVVMGFFMARGSRPSRALPTDVALQLQRLTQEVEEQRKKYEALPNLLASLSSVQEPDKLYASIAFVTKEQLNSEFSALFLRQDKDFVIRAAEGLSDESVRTLRLPLKEGLVRYIMETNWPVRMGRGDRQMSLFRSLREGFQEVMLAPLRTGGDVFGLLLVANRVHGTYSQSDLHLISYLCVPFSLAIHNASVFGMARRTVTDTLIEVARQVEERDPYARGHSARVADLAVKVGRALKLSAKDLEVLNIAARLHDLGKLALPLELWNKPGAFNEAEMEIMKSHPQRAVDLLKPLGYLDRALPLILYHHERYDGSGYPFALRGSAIPVGATIIGMAEMFDSLLHDRPHRKALTVQQALETMSQSSGTAFDPKLLRPFLQVVEKEIVKVSG